MFNRLITMYFEGLLGEVELDNAVKKGWITSAQRDDLLAIGAANTP